MSKIIEAICENCKKSFQYASKNHKGRFCTSLCFRMKNKKTNGVVEHKEPPKVEQMCIPKPPPVPEPEPVIKKVVFEKTWWEVFVEKIKALFGRE